MDRFERARELRDDYESSLDEAEKLRALYHREVLKLHRSGSSLREIAEQLGISHQRVHQIVGVAEEPRRRGRMIGGAVGVIVVLGGLILGWAVFRGSPSVRSSPRPTIEAQAPVRATLCTIAADTLDPFTPMPLSAVIARRCTAPSAIVAVDPRTGNILAIVSYQSPVRSIDGLLRDVLDGLPLGNARPADQRSL